MLWTGMAVGTLMVFGILSLWWKLPRWIKMLSLWSPLATDLVISGIVIMMATGISSSIIGFTAGLWCDTVLTIIIMIGHNPMLHYFQKQIAAEKKAKQKTKVGQGVTNGQQKTQATKATQPSGTSAVAAHG